MAIPVGIKCFCIVGTSRNWSKYVHDFAYKLCNSRDSVRHATTYVLFFFVLPVFTNIVV